MDEGIDNVKIIAIGREKYLHDNFNWIEGNIIPIVVDPEPYNIWEDWGAEQWDVYFLDSDGNYFDDFNIYEWDSIRVSNYIKNLLP